MILGNTELYKSYKSEKSSVLDKEYREPSLFVEALDMLTEHNRELNNILISIQRPVILAESSMKESTYVHEFSLSFKELLANVIDFFVETIKTLYKKFSTYIQKFIYSDQTILKAEKELTEFSGSFNVDYARYIYTVDDAYNPMVDLRAEFWDEIANLKERFKSIKNLKTTEERQSALATIESETQKSNQEMDQLRGRVLKHPYPISPNEYATECFNVYRDGGKEVYTKITDTEISTTFYRFKNYKKTVKDVERARDLTEREAKAVKKELESITIEANNKYYVPYNDKEEYIRGRILQKETGIINDTCNIFLTAYSAKLDALKESVVQDKKVLYDALKYIRFKKDND